ncbi:hypothetical protein H2248_004247 [Termitomyces sp. 'cryptogamus']|nr:hypothetical protein H2248_004247 [Termitomyces sp. 'cryptogamus']
MYEQAQHLVLPDRPGALLIGFLLAAVLYGVSTLQTYLYWFNYPKDRAETKVLVAAVWMLDTTHTVLMSICLYYYLVTNYGNQPTLTSGHWSLFTSLIINVNIAFLVHVFFTLQIFRFSKVGVRWWLASFTGLLSFAQFSLGIGAYANHREYTVPLCFRQSPQPFCQGERYLTTDSSIDPFVFSDCRIIKRDFSKFKSLSTMSVLPFVILALLSDMVITTALCMLLRGQRTESKRTNTLLNKLIKYAINRCVLILIVALAEAIIFCVFPYSLWLWTLDFVLCKLYSNSLLATLNSRRSLRASMTTFVDVEREVVEYVDNFTVPLEFSNQAEERQDIPRSPSTNIGDIVPQVGASQVIAQAREIEFERSPETLPVSTHKSLKLSMSGTSLGISKVRTL